MLIVRFRYCARESTIIAQSRARVCSHIRTHFSPTIYLYVSVSISPTSNIISLRCWYTVADRAVYTRYTQSGSISGDAALRMVPQNAGTNITTDQRQRTRTLGPGVIAMLCLIARSKSTLMASRICICIVHVRTHPFRAMRKRVCSRLPERCTEASARALAFWTEYAVHN